MLYILSIIYPFVVYSGYVECTVLLKKETGRNELSFVCFSPGYFAHNQKPKPTNQVMPKNSVAHRLRPATCKSYYHL